MAAAADCFALTFRGLARASRLPWVVLSCEVEGLLDRVDRVAQFSDFMVRARLQVPDRTHEELARRVLARVEQTCLVNNSFKGTIHLDATVDVVAPVNELAREAATA